MRFLLSIWFILGICFTAAVAVIEPALAQNATEYDSSVSASEASALIPAVDAAPDRVGRISLRSGNTSLRVSADTGWADAELNQPVFTGVAVRTDPQARAEIRVGANTITLSSGTEIEFTSLRDQTTQILVARGRIDFHLSRAGEGGNVEIDTSRGAIRLLAPGDYDIEEGSSGEPLRLAVSGGAASFAEDGNETHVAAGETMVLTGSDPIRVALEGAAPDAFVEWCRQRDYDESRLAAPYYISPYMTGFAELESAGSWKVTSQYGAVWIPDRIPEDWAPYRYGHWSWITPWGWTWIDDQPWGFAPFHYGRWAFVDGHWAWTPGGFVDRPIYMPAVVAFLGTPGIGLSSAEGVAVGWFPLAPGEAYWPSYTRDLGYIRNLNIGIVQDLATIRMRTDGEPPLEVFNEDFANRQYASVVPRPVFINGRPVAPALVAVPEHRLQNAPVLMGSPQIAPAAAQRVARAAAPALQTGRRNAPADRAAIAAPPKTDPKLVRATVMQLRGRGQPAIIRAAHLHAPSYAGPARGRQTLVLRVAHAGLGKGARH
jgi:hypothetical protein